MALLRTFSLLRPLGVSLLGHLFILGALALQSPKPPAAGGSRSPSRVQLFFQPAREVAEPKGSPEKTPEASTPTKDILKKAASQRRGSSQESESSQRGTQGAFSGSLKPEYPELARRMGIQGVVSIEVTIDETGRVQDYVFLTPRANKILEEAVLVEVLSLCYPQDESPLKLRVRFQLE